MWEVGPQPEDRIIGDMFFWTKLALKGPVGCVPRVLSHYVLLRCRKDNISHGTPPAVWARDSQLTVDEVFELRSRQAAADTNYLSCLRAESRRYIAQSTANQFIWNRLRGASAIQAWGWIVGCLPYFSWNLTVWTRVSAALMLPREVLTRLLLNAAARRAEARRANYGQPACPGARVAGDELLTDIPK
jgi:hypothetical protein